jgi:hypothetical protein
LNLLKHRILFERVFDRLAKVHEGEVEQMQIDAHLRRKGHFL